MPLARTSIAGLMALVCLAAVGIAALREASALWANLIVAVVLATLSLAALVAAFGGRRGRAFWAGFAACGGVYLILAWGTGIGPRLPITRWLIKIHPAVCRARTMSVLLPRNRFDESCSAWAQSHPGVETFSIGVSSADRSQIELSLDLPTLDAFQRIGESLVALAVGAVSGALSDAVIALYATALAAVIGVRGRQLMPKLDVSLLRRCQEPARAHRDG